MNARVALLYHPLRRSYREPTTVRLSLIVAASADGAAAFANLHGSGAAVVLMNDPSTLAAFRVALLLVGARARAARRGEPSGPNAIVASIRVFLARLLSVRKRGERERDGERGEETGESGGLFFLPAYGGAHGNDNGKGCGRSRSNSARVVFLGDGTAMLCGGGGKEVQVKHKNRGFLIFACPPPILPVCVAWTSRLAALTARFRAAEVGSAWISTLGGGHFLCRHVPQSLLLARLQVRIAESVTDAGGARRARLHFVYAAVLTGRWREGKRILRREEAAAKAANDAGFVDMATAARLYLAKTRALAKRGALLVGAGPTDLRVSDNLHRQRLVAYSVEGPLEGGRVRVVSE